MKTVYVSLSSIEDVKKFVNAACAQQVEIDVVSNRYVIDAKSIMGLFSIDLAKPIRVDIHGDEEESKDFVEKIESFVEEEEPEGQA